MTLLHGFDGALQVLINKGLEQFSLRYRLQAFCMSTRRLLIID